MSAFRLTPACTDHLTLITELRTRNIVDRLQTAKFLRFKAASLPPYALIALQSDRPRGSRRRGTAHRSVVEWAWKFPLRDSGGVRAKGVPPSLIRTGYHSILKHLWTYDIAIHTCTKLLSNDLSVN